MTLAAAAWFNAPADVDAYRRLAAAVGEWNAYCAPVLEDPTDAAEEELLDELAETSPPVQVGSEVDALAARLRRRAREEL